MKDLKKEVAFVNLGSGQEGINRLKTAPLVIQLFYPIEKEEIEMDDIDKAYQKLLDRLTNVIDNLSLADWAILQTMANIGIKLRTDKVLDVAELADLITKLQEARMINLDRITPEQPEQPE